MIHKPDSGGYPLNRAGRWLLAGWSFCLLAGFAVAAGLEPDPRGYGTHQKLGLPPCTFRELFNIPCPSCGMTTSFSNFIRGRFAQAARANVAGLMLAAACAFQIPWCWLSLVRGRLCKVDRPDYGIIAGLVVLCAMVILQWTARLILA